ncbi:hypothetical protein [uncultured Leptotrichia sp.]|uniref:hypothetical protein n=1 Tax=uncultured Leptotrichia sp. TaxID=159271 RepID=UPI0025E414A5|nr:hypothetical protein [uncultured Leptotrichia sp.]
MKKVNHSFKALIIQLVNLAINYLRGPCGPLSFGGAIRLLIDSFLLWNFGEITLSILN